MNDMLAKQVVSGKTKNIDTMDIDVKTKELPAPFSFKGTYEIIGTIEHTYGIVGGVLRIDVLRHVHSVEKSIKIPNCTYTLVQLAGFLLSAWALPSLEIAMDIAKIIFGNPFLNGTLEVFETKTITGTVSDYTWKGVPSNKTKGKMGYLTGKQIDFIDKYGNAKTYKEGYLPSAWKTDIFGRMMFYEVYKTEVNTTRWY